jgi:hypothetical protein
MLHHAVMDNDDLGRAEKLLVLLSSHPHARAGSILDYAGAQTG